jgi:tRNA (guanine10-N2)-methyltransferase
MRDPQHRFWVIVSDPGATGGNASLPPVARRIYFGREVAASERGCVSRYELRRRRYLGPTSMDTEMAFVMCNLGQARRRGRECERGGVPVCVSASSDA